MKPTHYNSGDKINQLMKRPEHKGVAKKFDKLTDPRSIAPLTSEDVSQFCNLGLMGSLRDINPAKKQQQSQIIENPPSFYEADLQKKEKRFSQAIKDRQLFKKQYYSKERRTILAGNDNFAPTDDDARIAEAKYTGGQI